MGKIKQGILGGFNGTTGSVVGASWKGIAYMRGKAQSIKNPRTTYQVANRTLFGAISDVMSKALSVVNIGYAGVSVKKSSFNVAVQENMKTMVEEGSGFVYESLKFSRGSLVPFIQSDVVIEGANIKCGGDLLIAYSDAKKACAVAVFDGDFADAPFVSFATTNMEPDNPTTTITIPIPANLDYGKAYVFMFCYDEVAKDASSSVFAGVVTPA